MSSAIDEDTRRTLAGGRETLGVVLRSAQKHLQKVFIVFVLTLVGTIWLLRNYVWDILKQDLLSSDAKVVFVTPFDVILLQVKIGLVVGALVAVPVLLYLSRDALRRRGWWPQAPVARWKLVSLASGILGLFTLGIVYAYFIFFPVMFGFLADTATNSGFRVTYSIVMWVEFIALLSLSFGIAAQLPLAMSTLAYGEIVPYETFRDRWKHAVVGLYAFGAVFTPPDPITQLMWATPLVTLYAVSLRITRIVVTVRRSSDRLPIDEIARDNWNVVAGVGVLAFLVVYGFFSAGGLELVNELTARLPGSFWPTLRPLGETLGVSKTAAAALAGVVVGLVAAAFAFYRLVARALDDLDPGGPLGGPAPASGGSPAEIDVGELDAAGIRVAPPEVFADMTEDDALRIAQDAMEEDDPERAEAVLDRYDEATELLEMEEAINEDPDASMFDEGEAADEPAPRPAEEVPPPSEQPGEPAPDPPGPDVGGSDGGDGGGGGPGGAVAGTTTGVIDAFTDEDTTEEDIGGYYTDIAFILDSITSRAFRIVGLFMGVLAIVFVWLYGGGIKQINDDFTRRLPEGMSAVDVQAVTLHPVEHLIFEIKFSTLVALVVTMPLIIYYAWPALKKRNLVTGDRRVLSLWAGSLIVGVGVGSFVGYAEVAPAVISWLAQDTIGADMIIAYRIKYYGWLIVYTTVGIGLLAEIPVTLFLFHYGGLVSFEAVWGRWREVVVTIFAFAALFSPKGVFTMLVLAVPIALSFLAGLGALWLATLGGRRTGT